MKLSSLISDGLVLQRDKQNCIWGKECEPGSTIEIKLNNKTVTGNADNAGCFKIDLPAVDVGGPYEISISENGKTVRELSNVMCGDVFLLAGQSNIELPLCRCLDMYEEEIMQMNLPRIHMFEVAKEHEFNGPVDELYEGSWQEAVQDKILLMSALGIFFARFHQERTGVPVGLIQTGVGGTHIESYLSEERVINIGKILRQEALKRGENIESCNCSKNDSCKVCYEKQLAKYKDSAWVKSMSEAEVKKQQEWSKKLDDRDIGLKEHWEKKTTLFENGEEERFITVPGRWMGSEYSELEAHRGSVWVLKTVDIPKHWLDKEIRVYLGTLVDADTAYVNGIKIGNTEYRYPPRRYRIPAGVLHEGENTIVLRVIANARSGGFIIEMPYYLSLNDEKISLEGKWQYKIGGSMYDENTGSYDEFEDITFLNWKPTAQYNRMVYPLRNLRFSSVLFYQGESNANHAWEYEYLMIEMVKCLRELFKDDLAFGFVELPKFGGEDGPDAVYDTTEWDNLRLAQERAAAKIENSTIADIYDLGFMNELHPQTKKEAAKLLYDKMCELMKW